MLGHARVGRVRYGGCHPRSAHDCCCAADGAPSGAVATGTVTRSGSTLGPGCIAAPRRRARRPIRGTGATPSIAHRFVSRLAGSPSKHQSGAIVNPRCLASQNTQMVSVAAPPWSVSGGHEPPRICTPGPTWAGRDVPVALPSSVLADGPHCRCVNHVACWVQVSGWTRAAARERVRAPRR